MSIWSPQGAALSLGRSELSAPATPAAVGVSLLEAPARPTDAVSPRHRIRAVEHEAASVSRRLKKWSPTTADISSIASSSGDMLVRRARQLVLANGYAASAKEEFAAALAGTGIRPSSTVEDQRLQDLVTPLWAEWVDEAESEGVTSFYGVQDLVAGALFDAGEAFVRMRPRRAADGLSVPLQLQVLESEFCDRTYSMPLANGNQIKAGIEFDRLGRRVAYWFWRQHPGDMLSSMTVSERARVPAESVLHVYEVQRPGQIRGLPKIVPGMVRLWLLDQYDDAELDRKKVAAMLAGFITQSDESNYFNPNGADETDDEGGTYATAEWQPGMLATLDPGQDIKFSEPTDVGSNYEAFQFRNLLAISAAIGIPYHAMTGDVSKANYSSLRADLVRFRRRVARLRRHVLIFQLCRRVWDEWVSAAVLAGALDVTPEQAEELRRKVLWLPPKWEWVDPLKDRQAEDLAIQMGVKTRSQVIIEEGNDPEDTDAQIARDQQRADQLGLRLGDAKAAVPAPDQDEDAQEQQREQRETRLA